MFIPAHQRYTQVLQMLGAFEAEYHAKADMLGMGLGALEMLRMRRISQDHRPLRAGVQGPGDR